MIAASILAATLAAPLELGWRAPESCPDVTAARATIDALLDGHAPDPARRVTADVVIEADAAGFLARVRIVEGDAVGEREVVAPTCEEVADASALIVAMAIDPRLGGSDAPSPDVPQALDTAVPEPVVPTPSGERAARLPTTPRAADDPPAVRPARARLRGLVRASAGVGVGTVPTVTGVVAIGLGVAGPRWRAELDADVWTPRRRDDVTIGVEVTGWSVGVRGCGSPLARRLEIPLCIGARAGAAHGRGVGDLVARRQVAPWLSATLGAGLWGWITPRFALALDVDAVVALTRPAFVVQPSGFVVRAPPAGVRAVFGPVLRWP